MNIGFIGFGNMAQAIVNGMVNKANIDPSLIHVCSAHFDSCQKNAEKYGVCAHASSLEVVENAELIVLAVKPYQIKEVVEPIRKMLASKIVVSIAAGCFYDFYEEILEPQTQHISSIPNTPIAIGKGILVTEQKHSLQPKSLESFVQLFSTIAQIEWVEAKQLSIATTIAGCAPAYTAMYLEALADAGVKHGLKRQQAYDLAALMMAGTSLLYLEKKEHPGIMKDAVCSPSGTTIKGVASLEKNAFRGIIIEAIDEVEK